jgi:hypothetical protein
VDDDGPVFDGICEMAIVWGTEDIWEGFAMGNPDRSRVVLSAEGGSSSTSESCVISDVVEVLSSS